jgi:hypothetical protein
MMLEFYRMGAEEVDWDAFIASDGALTDKPRDFGSLKRIVVDVPEGQNIPPQVAEAMTDQIVLYEVSRFVFYGFTDIWSKGRKG